MTDAVRSAARAITAIAAALAAHAAAAEEGGGHWSYDGGSGPAHWSEIDRAYAACAQGRAQSPIDLTGAAADSAGPEFHWRHLSAETEADNGHTIQVTTRNAGHILLDGLRYELAQFHFHHPSEHAVEGRRFPLEIHFVHQSDSGRLAVVGVLVEEGAESAALAPLWAAFPSAHAHPTPGVVALDGLSPEDPAAWRYDGSLTTPPCSEGVSWVVMQGRLTASPEQIAAFAEYYEDNARPPQRLNERQISQTR
jgi:carbonic anhydrase